MIAKLFSTGTLRLMTFVAVSLLTASCATPKLSVSPSSGVELSGRWYFDRAASDDTVQTVRASIKKCKPVDRQRAINPANGNPVSSDYSNSTLDGLREALPPDDADWLDIRQMRNSLSLDYAGIKKATYQSGQKLTVIDRGGTGIQVAGWDLDRYVIYNDYDGGYTLRQSFAIAADTDHLTQIIEIKSGRLKNKVVLRRYYDRQQ